MVITAGNFLLLAAVILIFSILITKAGYKMGVPTLLIFLIVGMIFGEDGVGIHFSNYEVAQFIGMIALLLAATMSSTDSASVFSILRSQKLKLRHNLRPLLELESGSNDPMAYMLTIVMIQVVQNGGGADISAFHIVFTFILQFVVGLIVGLLFGRVYVWIHNKLRLENKSLYQILIVGFIFLTFAITDMLGGNGYLAVYMAGIVVGNAGLTNGTIKILGKVHTVFGSTKIIERRSIDKLLDGLVWMVQIVMFLMLGLLVTPHNMLKMAIPAIIIGVFMIFVGRPLVVWISLLPFRKIGFKD